MTQLRSWVPLNMPLPLGASISPSMGCQAQGPGLREVAVPPRRGTSRAFPLPALTMPGIWQSSMYGGGGPHLGTPVPLCPDGACRPLAEADGREEESVLWVRISTFCCRRAV